MKKSMAPRLMAATASSTPPKPGHHDRDDFRVPRHRGIQDVEAVGVGQLEVDDQAVVGKALQPVERIRAGGRLRDDEPFAGQVLGNDFPKVVVVVDDEHAGLGAT